MTTWQGKSRGNVLGYQIFVFLLKNFGIKPAYLLLRFVAFYFLFFSAEGVKAIKGFLKNLYGKESVPSSLVYKSFYSFGQTLIDKVAVMAGFTDKFTYAFEGEENLVKMAEGGKGGFLVSAHLGNWEIAGFFLKRIKVPINIVMFDGEDSKIKEYMSEVAERNLNVILIKDDFSHVVEMSNALRNGELICIHGDRFVEGSKVEFADFLGKKAGFPRGPFQLISRLKVPYCFVFCMKEGNTHYHMYSTELAVCETDILGLVQEYAHNLENMAQKYPEQWFNYYDFWKAA